MDPISPATGTQPIAAANSKIDKAVEENQEELASVERSEETAQMDTSNKTSDELKAEIKKLESEKALNYKKMERIEAEIEDLTDKVKENMHEAQELQEKAIEEHKEEADKAVEDNIAAYVEANKEGGKGMTKEELNANISKSMPDSPNLARAIAQYVTASRELAEIDTLLDSLNNIILDTNGIEIDLKAKNEEYTNAVNNAQKVEEAKPAEKKCCDPIGFNYEGARYDFIVDDGSFDTTSDFLGSDNQWASMEALDADGDNVINVSELQAAGIKMVKTVDGQKQVVDVAEEFGEDFTVDLTSYREGGSYDGISNADSDADGIVDQQLLGTYTVHFDGKDVEGYNTLDDVDYLASEYGVTNDIEEKEVEFSDELAPHANFFNEYSDTAAKLDEELQQGVASLGLTESTIDRIKEHALKEGQNDANIFMQKMEAEAEAEQAAEEAAAEEAEAQEAQEAEEEAQAAEETEAQEAAEEAETEEAPEPDVAEEEAELAEEAGLNITEELKEKEEEA